MCKCCPEDFGGKVLVESLPIYWVLLRGITVTAVIKISGGRSGVFVRLTSLTTISDKLLFEWNVSGELRSNRRRQRAVKLDQQSLNNKPNLILVADATDGVSVKSFKCVIYTLCVFTHSVYYFNFLVANLHTFE